MLIAADFPVVPEDPLFFYSRQEFRLQHPLSVYVSPLPFTISGLSGNIFDMDIPGNAVFRIIPGLRLSDPDPVYRLHFYSAGRVGSITYLVEPVVVNKIYGEDLLGATYTRGGTSGRINNALLLLDFSAGSLQLGRSAVWQGMSWTSSLIQSGHEPAYDHLSARFNLGSFQLELLAGQLGSEQSAAGQRLRRHIAGHRFTWLPPTEKFIVGFGEQIIYSGVNRGFEWTYINPAVPYFFTALEGEEEEQGAGGSDNDNSIVFAYGRYVFKPNLSAYFEFILDDYQVDKNNVPNSLGWKLGMDGGRQVFDRTLTCEIEYTRIDSWTYIHHGEFTSWQNLGHPIGYQYGPDCRSFRGLFDYWLKPDIVLSFKALYLEKGANSLFTEWASPGTRGYPFPSKPVTYYTFTNTSLAWHAKYGIVESGYTNLPVGDAEINGEIPAINYTPYLKLQLVWTIGFDL